MSNVESHMEQTEDKIFKLICKCGKEYKQQWELTRHMRKHTNAPNYVCDECGKSFTERWDFIRHGYIHSGEHFQFECPECKKRLTKLANLKYHMKVKHNIIDDLDCPTCLNSFKDSESLQQHRDSGSCRDRFVCQVCDKPFRSNTDLIRHTRGAHTRETPFSCSECNKSFALKSTLVIHSKTHSEDRPFACVICGKCFKYKGYLHQHRCYHTKSKSVSKTNSYILKKQNNAFKKLTNETTKFPVVIAEDLSSRSDFEQEQMVFVPETNENTIRDVEMLIQGSDNIDEFSTQKGTNLNSSEVFQTQYLDKSLFSIMTNSESFTRKPKMKSPIRLLKLTKRERLTQTDNQLSTDASNKIIVKLYVDRESTAVYTGATDIHSIQETDTEITYNPRLQDQEADSHKTRMLIPDKNNLHILEKIDIDPCNRGSRQSSVDSQKSKYTVPVEIKFLYSQLPSEKTPNYMPEDITIMNDDEDQVTILNIKEEPIVCASNIDTNEYLQIDDMLQQTNHKTLLNPSQEVNISKCLSIQDMDSQKPVISQNTPAATKDVDAKMASIFSLPGNCENLVVHDSHVPLGCLSTDSSASISNPQNDVNLKSSSVSTILDDVLNECHIARTLEPTTEQKLLIRLNDVSDKNSLDTIEMNENGDLRGVVKLESSEDTNEMNLVVTNKDNKIRASRRPKEMTKCPECYKVFLSKYSFKEHSLLHRMERPFVCEICQKGSTSIWTFKNHMRIHGERNFSCHDCTASFYLQSDLIRHFRRHTGEKPFHCPECSKTFTVKSSLVKHARFHSGEKPFVCHICQISFSQNGNLQQHRKTHEK